MVLPLESRKTKSINLNELPKITTDTIPRGSLLNQKLYFRKKNFPK